MENTRLTRLIENMQKERRDAEAKVEKETRDAEAKIDAAKKDLAEIDAIILRLQREGEGAEAVIPKKKQNGVPGTLSGVGV